VEAAPLERLTIELTEHSAVADYGALVEVLRPLRDSGARLSVDDTGSGYSGLVHIMQLLPEVIKLDRQLTTGVHQDPVRQALATALVTFAGRIGAAVVAEGIEVEGEAQVLSALGVGYGQGYLFGRPGPVQALSTQTNG
jgi:EAL domain-containing protein (putative c-di-GMP-specific phosphodiesterase class I)